jgi:hypothetical protein
VRDRPLKIRNNGMNTTHILLSVCCLAAFASHAAPAPSSQISEPITLLTYRDAEWYGSTFWTGPDWTRVGKNWHHPGENTPSVRRFTAPRDGRVTVTGRVFKLHLDGDGIRASIRHQEREVWQAEIDGKDDKGVEPKLTLDLKQGDALRFIVHKRGGIPCDTTGWDPVVTYGDGERFQASVAFAARKQGEGGWFYEMLGQGEVPQPPKPPAPVPNEMKQELTRLAPSLAPKSDRDLLLLALEEWWRDDKLTDTADAYTPAVANHLRRARDLAADLGATPEALEKLSSTKPTTLTEWRMLYLKVRLLKRDLALSHPLLDFDKLLFCKRAQPSYSHLVGQYFGWRQRPGGGLFVLERLGGSLAVRDIVGSQLPAGSFLEPRLSYDGQRVVFSFVSCSPKPPNSTALPVNERGDESGYYHIYEINADGTGLRQLTRGRYDDMMPCYLPDGGIAFVSTRRRSYSRCFGPNFSNRWHSYTLHRMNADGSGLRILSLNDVSEWFPSVSNTGEILFARWDYIDRDAVTHQNLWSVRPDGCNPIAVWGNATPKPHCTFQAKAIPGSRKIAFIASAHHAVTGGPVCVVDPAVDPNSQNAITRITPGPYPEAESDHVPDYYQSPWPLSEKYFLIAYSRDRLVFEGEHLSHPNPDNALGLYLLDAAGNRELLYRDAELGSTCPIPLKPQPTPHVLPSTLAADAPPTGEMLVSDIYQGLGDLPRGTIKELRIVQIFPKTTWIANAPQIGVAGEENTRAILGTVPVEADGSARFIVPAHKPILFQALDRDGFAYQTMRSTTYVQPGERTSCVGCHEHRMLAPTPTAPVPLAMQRAPSHIEPGELGGRPFSFVEVVQPVLNQHCLKCHSGPEAKKGLLLTGEPLHGFTRSYLSLTSDPPPAKQPKPPPVEPLVPRFAMRNQIQTTPVGGKYGALGSRLLKMLRAGHNDVQLSDSDLRRLAAWIDCNAIFYGTFDSAEQAKQLAGERVAMPEIQ